MADRFLSIPEIRVGLPPVVAAVLVIGAVARFAVFNAGTLLPLMVAGESVGEKTVTQQAVADRPTEHRLAEVPNRRVSLFDPTADRSLDDADRPSWDTDQASGDGWPIVLAAHPVEDGGSPLTTTDRRQSETFIRVLESRTAEVDRAAADAVERASRMLERQDLDPTRFKSIQYFENDRCVPCTAG